MGVYGLIWGSMGLYAMIRNSYYLILPHRTSSLLNSLCHKPRIVQYLLVVLQLLALAGLADAEVAFVEVQASRAQGIVAEVQNPFWVESLVEEAALEVQVRAGAVAGAATEAYHVASGHLLAVFDVDF